MAGGTVAAFWAVSFLFVVTPGADWAYAIAAGLRHRTVLPAVGGLLAGHLAATAVVAAGVAALVARSPLVLTALTVAGAAYLVWLGIGMLARPAAPQAGVERDGRVVAAAGGEGRGDQRAQPEGVPAVLGAAAAVHRPGRGLAARGADRGAGPGARGQLRRDLHRGGHRARRVLRARPAAARAVTRFSGPR